MASETVKVIVRCRPINSREKDLKCDTVVSMVSNCGQCSIVNPEDLQSPPKTFTFDGAYFIDSTTEQIYNEIVYPIVESVTEGYNATVFAYGQTGCGKSFSMQGIPSPASQRGIIPRSFEHIFEAIATAENTKFLVHASYLEIYNEEIRDLLGIDPKKKLDLKEHPERGVYTPGLSMHPVHNVKECEQVMDRGWKNRSTGATLMNADSSRSHSIFTICMEKMDVGDEGDHIRQGKLNLVDLAGSERQGKTGATGDRLKEATKINLSLSALGNVISALVDGKSKHIPYRDSKLTRLLQDSLGGNTKTLMVACLSPADNNYDETLSTLRYANRAKNITNKPRINEDPKDALLREYQEEIRRLKSLLTGTVLPSTTPGTPHRSSTSNGVAGGPGVEVALAAVREEYDAKMEDLMDKYRKEQENNAQLHSDVSKLKEHYEQELQKLNQQRQQVTDQVKATELVPENKQNGYRSAGSESPIPTIQAAEPLRSWHPCTFGGNNPRHTPALVTEFLLHSVPPTLEEMQAHALERLQELEERMVGGEKANDRVLKENRAKRKNVAEKRLHALSEALSKLDDDDRVMLKVYDDIHEELKAKTSLVKKAKRKIQSLESEIGDLHREFEADRTDYLETIRRQDQQIKLVQQILDKIHPCLRRDCNYASLDRIKAESYWDEEIQRWRMPELVVVRTRLPPPGVQPGGRPVVSIGGVHSANSLPNYYNSDNEGENGQEDKFFQKLERSVQEDVAGNYFRPKRQEQLLSKFQDAAEKVLSSRKVPNGFKSNGVSTLLHATNLLQTTVNGHSQSTSNLSGNSSPEDRKPGRLQALAALGAGDVKRNKRNRTRHLEPGGPLDQRLDLLA